MTLARTWLPCAGLAVGIALLSGGVAGVLTVPSPRDVGTVPEARTHSAPLTTVRAAAPAQEPPPAAAFAPAQAPLRVRIPTLSVNAPVVPVDTAPDNTLTVPEDPATVGWWSAGAWPGDRHGTVVLAGHVDTDEAGAGALFRLNDLRPGDVVALQTAQGTLSYRVRALRHYPKRTLPAETFDHSGAPRLVLITCGGRFDVRNREYTDNVVAYATSP
ncbi:class F sortase [Amycolatopsis sp. NPDC023774]|uniref:class F sortase n=1 Tax=Amycolatopsis sp. NPDC023774 TaxID=3155015 RepID=UPI0033EF43A7